MSKLVDLSSRSRYHPDVVGLACGRVASARARLGVSRADFAKALTHLLGWTPSADTIELWEKCAAPPPGDVITASEILAPRAELNEIDPGLLPVTVEQAAILKTGLASALVPADSLALVQVSPVEFGDSDYLESIRDHIREIVALDNRFGGADLVRMSTRFFRTLHNQLGVGAYNPKLERDLHAAAGELAEVVGWLAYDAEEHDLTRRMNQESLYFTRLSGDKSTELLTLQNSSMHAAAQGHPREALQIASLVLEGDYQLSPRLRALFLTRKARALAQGGDEGALHLFPEIRALFLDGVSDADPAWTWWIDERELAWHEAMAQRDLGLAGKAIAHFEQSVIATPATEIRSQYLHRSYLLQAQVDNSSWAAAEETIRQLLPLSAEVASTRTVVLLRNVLSQLTVTQGKVPVALQEQAAKLSAALETAPV